MSKKQKVVEAQIQQMEAEKQNQISEGVLTDAKTQAKAQKVALKAVKKAEKQEAKAKLEKGKKSKKGKEKKGGLVKKTKETMSELKKVTWPSFGEVVKKTGVVVAFVLIFGVFLFGLNYLLGGLVNLLVNGTWIGL